MHRPVSITIIEVILQEYEAEFGVDFISEIMYSSKRSRKMLLHNGEIISLGYNKLQRLLLRFRFGPLRFDCLFGLDLRHEPAGEWQQKEFVALIEVFATLLYRSIWNTYYEGG
jgi:hypothetical protein